MIQKYVAALAVKMGIQLSEMSLVDGKRLSCVDATLLYMGANGHTVSVVLYQKDIEDLQQGKNSGRLEERICAALLRLKMMLEP